MVLHWQGGLASEQTACRNAWNAWGRCTSIVPGGFRSVGPENDVRRARNPIAPLALHRDFMADITGGRAGCFQRHRRASKQPKTIFDFIFFLDYMFFLNSQQLKQILVKPPKKKPLTKRNVSDSNCDFFSSH